MYRLRLKLNLPGTNLRKCWTSYHSNPRFLFRTKSHHLQNNGPARVINWFIQTWNYSFKKCAWYSKIESLNQHWLNYIPSYGRMEAMIIVWKQNLSRKKQSCRQHRSFNFNNSFKNDLITYTGNSGASNELHSQRRVIEQRSNINSPCFHTQGVLDIEIRDDKIDLWISRRNNDWVYVRACNWPWFIFSIVVVFEFSTEKLAYLVIGL